MDILIGIASTKRNIAHKTLSLAVAAGLSLGTAAFADDQTAMAPPIQVTAPPAAGVTTGADSVFNWQEIPANQEVPLTRAAFDQGGYQLYDTVGETIVVPFTNQNLYVMKFARSDNGKMYFMNEGGYPVLYVPQNGYLDNATVAGARWYPFGGDFHPAQPVFLGIAPSWSAFSSMGWYPDMAYYGGYWGTTSFIAGGVFLPSVGLYFAIGGHPYYGWSGYHNYIVVHPAPYHIAYYRHDLYRWADRPHTSFRPFVGAGHTYYAHQAFAGAPKFGGTHIFNGGHHFEGDHTVSGPHSGGEHIVSGGHTFHGGTTPLPGVHGGERAFTTSHTFTGAHGGNEHTATAPHGNAGHTFSGAHGGNEHISGGTPRGPQGISGAHGGNERPAGAEAHDGGRHQRG